MTLVRLWTLIIGYCLLLSCKNNIAPTEHDAAPVHFKLADMPEKHDLDKNSLKTFPGFPGSLPGSKGDTPLALRFSADIVFSLTAEPQTFDIDGDGQSELIDWLHEGSLLAIDLNGNQKIDSGRELFGNGTLSADGHTTFTDGFAALADYDDDANGFIDARDAVFSKLIVWRDTNNDAVSQPHELFSCVQLGITSFDLRATSVNLQIQTSRLILESSFVVNGEKRDFVDIVFLRYESAGGPK